jgi:hypothetical protein
MKNSSKLLLSAFAVILLAGSGAMLVVYRHSSTRVLREHGISIPSSASSIRCGGDGWKRWFSDCCAIATFEISEADLPAFIGAVSAQQTYPVFGAQNIPNNVSDIVTPSWMSVRPNSSYKCQSVTGGYLTLSTWSLPDSRVGILLYTDWN